MTTLQHSCLASVDKIYVNKGVSY